MRYDEPQKHVTSANMINDDLARKGVWLFMDTAD